MTATTTNNTVPVVRIDYALSTMSVDTAGDEQWLDRLTDRIVERLSAAYPDADIRVTLNTRDSQSVTTITYEDGDTLPAYEDEERVRYEIQESFSDTP